MKDFKDRVALITGAANGFGKEFVKKCHEKIRRIMITTDGIFPEKSDFVV